MPRKVVRSATVRQSRKWSDGQVRSMQELRRSNAAGIHKGQGEYQRRPKHVKRGWE